MIKELNNQFGIDNEVIFSEGQNGFTLININSNHASAAISLYGAQILSYTPAGGTDILWLSEKALFQKGKAIRGGVPVCFPWFGPHSTDKTKPQHGFARLEEWKVESISKNKDGIVIISLYLEQTADTLAIWPYHFKAVATFYICETLEIDFTVTNTGDKLFEYSDALHTYFNVSDISKIEIEGLEETDYFEFGDEQKTQSAPVLTIDTETDRKYIHHSTHCTIHDPGYRRSIIASKTGSNITVVWNPWEAATEKIADMVPGGYKTFVCVEAANAIKGIDLITLLPGKTHSLAVDIELSSHN